MVPKIPSAKKMLGNFSDLWQCTQNEPDFFKFLVMRLRYYMTQKQNDNQCTRITRLAKGKKGSHELFKVQGHADCVL
jgi:hypothetical protein